MAVAEPAPPGWLLSVEPVGPLTSLFQRLRDRASDGCVALGVDFPIGLPRAFVARHLDPSERFPMFLRALATNPGFSRSLTKFRK